MLPKVEDCKNEQDPEITSFTAWKQVMIDPDEVTGFSLFKDINIYTQQKKDIVTYPVEVAAK